MLLTNARVEVPPPRNEPMLDYAPGSNERRALKDALAHMASEVMEIPMVIGGERVRGEVQEQRLPHNHGHVLARFHNGGAAETQRAINAARAAWPAWSRTPWQERAAIVLRAAEILATRQRMRINAATMLGQSKTVVQAEVDAACELIDFWRWNVHFASELYAQQPASSPGVWNATELRPLDGFVLAVTPFNFTAIGGNLTMAPALMGNVVVWKPAPTAMASAWVIMQVLEEAGLPAGVVNHGPGAGPTIGATALADPNLAGVHFTGSTGVFQWFWRTIGENITRYRNYPRVVGETGGKDFIVAHASANKDALITAIVRGGFELQGQKCSAASRIYVARSMWDKIKDPLLETTRSLTMGDVADFSNFMGAVIDEKAWKRITSYIALAKHDPRCKLLVGGEVDDRHGWFVRPTLVLTEDPRHRLMQEEIFGPVVTLPVDEDASFEDTLSLVDTTSPYGLTGAIFADDRLAVALAHDRLRHSAGNFYVNDKPTGAVVGQQPFGGARASGTNDKAGSAMNLLRWVSARTVKENFTPPTHFAYPAMRES